MTTFDSQLGAMSNRVLQIKENLKSGMLVECNHDFIWIREKLEAAYNDGSEETFQEVFKMFDEHGVFPLIWTEINCSKPAEALYAVKFLRILSLTYTREILNELINSQNTIRELTHLAMRLDEREESHAVVFQSVLVFEGNLINGSDELRMKFKGDIVVMLREASRMAQNVMVKEYIVRYLALLFNSKETPSRDFLALIGSNMLDLVIERLKIWKSDDQLDICKDACLVLCAMTRGTEERDEKDFSEVCYYAYEKGVFHAMTDILADSKADERLKCLIFRIIGHAYSFETYQELESVSLGGLP